MDATSVNTWTLDRFHFPWDTGSRSTKTTGEMVKMKDDAYWPWAPGVSLSQNARDFLVNLGEIETKRCRHCHRDLPPNHYSIQATTSAFDEHKNACNECRVSTPGGHHASFMQENTDWARKAACTPEASGKTPEELDAIMFPSKSHMVRSAPWTELCAWCPVAQECARYGDRTKSEGVYGGVYRFMLRGRMQYRPDSYTPMEES